MAITGTYSAGDAISFGDCVVEVDLVDDATWARIDSWATEISVTGEDIPRTETYPFTGSAIVFVGVKSPVEVSCTMVYTEGSTDPYQNLRDRFEGGNDLPCEIRWVPRGSASGYHRYTTSGGKLTACPPPQGAGDASSANVATFVITADSLGRDAIT
jgi:hypothetical protein